MKINIKSLRRDKRVYYYKRQNGVLERKVTTRYRVFSGALVALFMIGGGGALTSQIVKHAQQQAAAPSMQRQTVAVDTAKKVGEEDKLKNAEKKAREDEQLAKKVKTKLKNVPGGQKWSVYIRDVKSDRMASINADNTFDAANLGNLFVAVPLEAKVPAANWNYRAGKSTTAKCLQEAIMANDQSCEQTINRSANLANANNVLDSQGFKKTSITDKEQKTTAREMGELLFRLQNSQVLSDKARRVVFDALYGQHQREGIPASCKDDAKCLVANIAGEDKNVRHDAAIVTTGSAQYVVVIMTNGGSWSQIADVSSMIRTELQP